MPVVRAPRVGHPRRAPVRLRAPLRLRVRRGAAARAEGAEEGAQALARLVRAEDVDDDAVKAAIDRLAGEARGTEVDAGAFGNEAWEVVWSEGTMAWRALVANFVQAIAGTCRAGQAIAPSDDGAPVWNWAELFDGRVVVLAEGTCAPIPGRDSMPVAYDVSISRGAIRFGTQSFDIPISGPGQFEVLYADRNAGVRVFRSSGGIAVQVPSDFEKPKGM